MNAHPVLISAVVGYLLGSIPFGYLLVRIFCGADVRATGSGNIGATNVARMSAKLGVITLLLDALKGAAAVATAGAFSLPELMFWIDSNAPPYPEHPWTPLPVAVTTRATIGALCAIVGHVFPVWLKFRGGKGVATALGAFVLLAPRAMVAAVGVFVLVTLVSRYISLGSVSAATTFPLFVRVFYREEGFTFGAMTAICAGSALIVAKHHSNIRRILVGTEPRFHLKHK
jgi:glycerol-3-phosphate acyltransferase PlsY